MTASGGVGPFSFLPLRPTAFRCAYLTDKTERVFCLYPRPQDKMSEFKVVQTITMTREYVLAMLVDADRHNWSERTRINTPEDPSALRGYYNIPIDWDDWWRCFNETIAPTSAVAKERYGEFKVSPSDIIKKATDAYHQTDRFVSALTEIKEAIKQKEIADKAEEVRVRQDVPEITKRYDALLLEKADMEKQLKAYKAWNKRLCGDIREVEQIIHEAKWAPKYHKEKMESLKKHTIAKEWDGKALVVENTHYGW